MTGEDLRSKTGVAEKAKFEYCPLDKVFTKELKEHEKEEGLLKSFKKIEGTDRKQLEMQLEAIKNNAENEKKRI